MSKIVSSVHPGMIDKADSEWPWPGLRAANQRPVFRSRDHSRPIREWPPRPTRGSFLLLLSKLWRCHWVFLQQTHCAFTGDSVGFQASSNSISILIRLFLFSLRHALMMNAAFRECDVKNIQKCQVLCSCLVLFVSRNAVLRVVRPAWCWTQTSESFTSLDIGKYLSSGLDSNVMASSQP